MEHFSTEAASIFELGYQILEIDNLAALKFVNFIFLSQATTGFWLSFEARSLALCFLESTELSENCPVRFLTIAISFTDLRFPLAFIFLNAAM